MPCRLPAIPLVFLLLLQGTTDGLMLQWQATATDSFAQLFCVNRATEAAPMCYGECRITSILEQWDGSEEDGIRPLTQQHQLSYLIPSASDSREEQSKPTYPAVNFRVRIYRTEDHRPRSFEPPAVVS